MSDKLNDQYFAWLDIETNDLAPGPHSVILEIGLRVTDLELNIIDSFETVIGHKSLDAIQSVTSDYVKEMHTRNGLWAACADEACYTKDVEVMAMDWWDEASEELSIAPRSMPLAGSSLAMDRSFLGYWMPDFHKLFHYRSIDNSTTKELCRRYNPDLYAKLPETDTDHRVATCLNGTLEEFRFYKDNFLIEGGE